MLHRLDRPQTAPVLVLAGGVGLGAYQAGAYEALHDEGAIPQWLAGSSTGAINAALIAGTARDQRIETLRTFWSGGDFWNASASAPFLSEDFRHLSNWLSVVRTRLFGAAGHFRPRMPLGPLRAFRSFYDLAPMRERLRRLIDFERLNSGETRLCVATTDIESGDLVVFDTQSGARIEMDHLLASCGFLPEFAPVEIDGKLLGDGGLCANAPVEIVLAAESEAAGENLVFVVDLFAPDGGRPSSLEAALARKSDLMFGTQTLRILRAYCAAGRCSPGAVFYLSYRAASDEAGPEKMFDLSRATVEDRWTAGKLDMLEALQRASSSEELPPLTIVRRRHDSEAPPRRAASLA